ncbi:replication initiator protein A [Pseudomonas asuensis]
MEYEVLTLDKKYFELTQSIDRRLYEIARKHVGAKAFWKCDIDIVREKTGTTQDIRRFRSEIRDVIRRDPLPEYRIALDKASELHRIVFYTRDNKLLSKALINNDLAGWFENLERHQCA